MTEPSRFPTGFTVLHFHPDGFASVEWYGSKLRAWTRSAYLNTRNAFSGDSGRAVVYVGRRDLHSLGWLDPEELRQMYRDGLRPHDLDAWSVLLKEIKGDI